MSQAKNSHTTINFKNVINYNDIRVRIDIDKNEYSKSGKEWATYLGVEESTVSNFHRKNNPRNPSFEYILAVAYKTGKPVEWYLYGTQPPVLRTESVNESAESYTSGVGLEGALADLPYFQILKTILESDDEVTKKAIKANLEAFAESISRAGEIKKKLETIDSLNDRLLNIEKVLRDPGVADGESGTTGSKLKKAM